MTKFKVNDRVVLIDVSNSTGFYQEGQVATIIDMGDGRLTVLFDGQEFPVSGKETRFRLLTPLDKVL